MTEEVNDVQDVEVSDEEILNDPELRKLPMGSDEFKAAVASKATKTEASDEATDVVPADDDQTDDDSDDDDSNEDGKKPKKAKNAEKRIHQLVQRSKAAEQRERELQERLSQYEQQPKNETTASVEGKPKADQYANAAEYIDALTDWKLQEHVRSQEREVEQREYQNEYQRNVESWDSRESEVVESTPDYYDVVNVEAIQALNPTAEVKQFLGESEHGPLILYSMLSDDDALDQFLDATPIRQVAMLAQAEAYLATSADDDDDEVEEKPVTKAPPPPSQRPKGKTVASRKKSVYSDDISFEEYDRLRAEQRRNRNK